MFSISQKLPFEPVDTIPRWLENLVAMMTPIMNLKSASTLYNGIPVFLASQKRFLKELKFKITDTEKPKVAFQPFRSCAFAISTRWRYATKCCFSDYGLTKREIVGGFEPLQQNITASCC